MTTMPRVKVVVGGRTLAAVQQLHLVFGIVELADQAEIVFADRIVVRPGEAVEVFVDDRPVLVGNVLANRRRHTATDRTRTISAYSLGQAMTRSSVVLGRKAWADITVRELARQVAEPFGLGVEVDPSAALADEPLDRIRLQDGETAFDFLRRACKRIGCIVTSGAAIVEAGGRPRPNLLLTQVAPRRCDTDLVFPNSRILELDVEDDIADRHSIYYVNRRGGGRLDPDTGDLVGVDGVAEDLDVPYSPLIKKAEAGGHKKKKGRGRRKAGIPGGQAELERQAEAEMRRRAAESHRVSMVIDGWSPAETGTGYLWTVNTLVRVVADLVEGSLDEELLISSVELNIDIGNHATAAKLQLIGPDAYSVFERPQLKSGSGRSGYHVDPTYAVKNADLVWQIDEFGRPSAKPVNIVAQVQDDLERERKGKGK